MSWAPLRHVLAALWPAARGMAQTVNTVAPAILARILAAAADLQVRVCAGPKQVTSYKGESDCDREAEKEAGRWRQKEMELKGERGSCRWSCRRGSLCRRPPIKH